MKRLPDTELEVMKALWDAGADVPRAVLDQALAPFQWASNTVNTYLSRLAEKGFVSVRREGRSNLYTPLVSQEDYLAFDSPGGAGPPVRLPQKLRGRPGQPGVGAGRTGGAPGTAGPAEGEACAVREFLFTLTGLTLGGSAAVCLLALAGRSTRARYGARWRCLAWLLLCLRLAVPFSLLPVLQSRALIQVPVPAVSIQQPSGQRPLPVPAPEQSAQTPGTSPNRPGASGQTAPDLPAPQQAPSRSPVQLLFLLWLTGAAAVLIWNLAAHLRLLAYLRRWAAPVHDPQILLSFQQLKDRMKLERSPRLLICQGLKVPMLAGVIRPALLLPPEPLSQQELHCSLLHELTHFRRRDIWLRALALWVKALYWFNPLCWLMERLIQRDTELACDEEVLSLLSPEEHAAYGQTILSAAARLCPADQEGGPGGRP